uniref:Uncharacterized protein n=1 Tax=Ditylenchus dipsaci TaxID=166011 RepID=A0A915EI23_9BILA
MFLLRLKPKTSLNFHTMTLECYTSGGQSGCSQPYFPEISRYCSAIRSQAVCHRGGAQTQGRIRIYQCSCGELLFDGYKDPIVSSICDHFLMRSICASAGIPDRVGLLYKQNNTDDGLYEINAGVDSVYNLGKLYSWNNMSVLTNTAWYGPQARMINGSDGQLFPPNLFLTKNLEIFVGKISRSLEMEQSGYAEVDDLPAFKYIPAKSMNSVAIQRAKGFCNPDSPRFYNDTNVQEEGCAPAGLMDVSSVEPGNPRIYVSQPHFYNSPKELGESIVGIAGASLENDQTFFNIEPLTGVIVSAAGKSQLNVGVIKGNLRAFANMKDLIVPIVWMNESALIDAGTKAQVMRAVSAIHLTFVWGVILIALGASLVFTFAGVVVFSKYINKTSQNPAYDPLANDTDSISSNIHHTPVAIQPETFAQTPAVLQPVPQL